MIQDILQESGKRIVERFANDLMTMDLTSYGPAYNTGNAANSIAFALTDNGYVVTGNDYIMQLIYGRKPGTQPPLSAIEKWMQEKGLEGSAFPIARAIAQKGTVIFQTHHGQASGLFEKAIQEEALILRKQLVEYYQQLVIQSLLD